VGTFSQAGLRAAAEYGRNARGTTGHSYGFDAGASMYPALLDVSDPFGELHAEARASIPLFSATGPFVSLRAGGQHVLGEFPVHDAAFLGGRHSLRGYQTDRFAGDASLYGSTELHAPLGEIELLVRGTFGVFGLADAGRVYLDGDSPGGWHTAVGGGVWFATLGRAVSLMYAHGESGRLYLELGLPLRR
jgi:hemolysin activation/secretion protein